jgi:nucleoside-diphosphate-sugar epimerase
MATMNVTLTGATGFIGSHVMAELQEHGHEVTALVRGDTQSGIVAQRGATAVVVDLSDRAAVASLLNDADAAIHTASPGDATSADLDSAVADAAIDAFAGYLIADETNPTVAELTEVAAGAPGAVPGSDAEARARLGDYLAEVLLLDQSADAAKARAELDWHPSHPPLVDDFRHGSYRNVAIQGS